MTKKHLIALGIIVACGLVGFGVLKQQELRRFAISLRQEFQEKQYSDYEPANHDVWGIDISHHQKNVDWNEMSKRKPDFIFLKATEGSTHVDTKYKSYKKSADKFDIPTGAYHFFSYQSDGESQANHFIKTANRFCRINLVQEVLV